MGIFDFLHKLKNNDAESKKTKFDLNDNKYAEDNIDPNCIDPLFEDAARLIIIHQISSTSLIQRKFAITYSRAGHIMDQLEMAGIVGAFHEEKAREIFYSNMKDLDQFLSSLRADASSVEEIKINDIETNISKIDKNIINKGEFIQVSSGILKQYHGCIPPDIFAKISLSKNDDALITIEKSIFNKIEKDFNCLQEFETKLFETTRNNNEGIFLEKSGEIEKAIHIYERNIEIGYPATHSYDRLMTLYNRNKDYQNEARIAKNAIDIFSIENEKRYKKSIEEHPELKEEIEYAYFMEEKVMDNNAFYIYVPYKVKNYKNRLEKIIHKIQ